MKAKFVIVLIFSLLFLLETKGQTNLVPNPSFELYDTCPYTGGQLSFAEGWFQPNTIWNNVLIGSTDYFNNCTTNSTISVPSNTFGYQNSINGNSYVGFQAYENVPGVDYREYLEIKLISTLIQGKTYKVIFNVSLSEISDCAIGSIGLCFSNDSLLYNDINSYNISVIPQIESNSTIILSDTLNWLEISDNYIAQGGENFITIGNFRNNINTPFLQIKDTTTQAAYYYIDDISIVCIDCIESTTEIAVPTAFSPNGDGHNDQLRVLGNTAKIEFKIFNRWGEMVYSYNGTNMTSGQGWDGTYKGSSLNNGVFAYYATATMPDGKEVSINGNVSLIK
jgi:OOP family OmpA-OmpF porin